MAWRVYNARAGDYSLMVGVLLHSLPNKPPVVSAYFVSGYVRALVDTGAHMSVLNPTLASLHQFPILGGEWVHGIAPLSVHARIIEVPNIRLGGLALGLFRAYILPPIQLGRGIEMVLGVNALKDLRLETDLKGGELSLS